MPSTWENIRVSGTMLLRDGLALSPILAAYQGKSLIPPPSPSGATQLIIAVIAATGLSTLFEFAPMLLGLRPPASKSPLFFPVTTFVVLTDVGAWAATLVLARKGLTGRGDWLLDTMARLQLASSVLLGIGSVIRKFLKAGELHPELTFSEKVQWELLGITLVHIVGSVALQLRRRWEH